jgi:hypothetical protein
MIACLVLTPTFDGSLNQRLMFSAINTPPSSFGCTLHSQWQSYVAPLVFATLTVYATNIDIEIHSPDSWPLILAPFSKITTGASCRSPFLF